MVKDVDTYLAQGCMRCKFGGTPACKVQLWQPELATLRALILTTGLSETTKWGAPCYTYQGKNILMLSALKTHCTISFFKGALLEDEHQLLHQSSTQAHTYRLLTFTSVAQIEAQSAETQAFIFQAIEIERQGLKIETPPPAIEPPVELLTRFAADPDFRTAFYALTPGRQRGYLLHFSQPKQAQTRLSRIDAAYPNIMAGIGPNDKYAKGRKP
jgi:uncharacterized protein YdeI (YjbR/CyaY-like superfamily)